MCWNALYSDNQSGYIEDFIIVRFLILRGGAVNLKYNNLVTQNICSHGLFPSLYYIVTSPPYFVGNLFPSLHFFFFFLCFSNYWGGERILDMLNYCLMYIVLAVKWNTSFLLKQSKTTTKKTHLCSVSSHLELNLSLIVYLTGKLKSA